MKKEVETIFLRPGEFFWGQGEKRIITILGSCISICLWHPFKRIGGICHYQMPGRREEPRKILNPKYGDDTIWLILKKVHQSNTRPGEYLVKVFGGALILNNNHIKDKNNISNQNSIKAIERLGENGFTINSHDLGGKKGRKLFFDLWDGTVWIKKVERMKN